MRDFQTEKVLISVLTYPHPSQMYDELICTAGFLENGEWVRLYPIDLRYLPKEKRFQKYQWVKIRLEKAGHRNDPRKESRRPDRDSIEILGPPLSTVNGWEERRKIIEPLPTYTLNELKAKYDTDKISLGIVRPARVIDLKIEEDQRNWKPKQENILNQMRLFGERKPLTKIPFRFQYVFECEDSDAPHHASLTDWEAGVLWLNELDRLKDEMRAAESVRKKFFGEICREDRETRFFMGTVLPFNTWLVLGVFWPPKIWQPSLF